jgi:hypothetical protein
MMDSYEIDLDHIDPHTLPNPSDLPNIEVNTLELITLALISRNMIARVELRNMQDTKRIAACEVFRYMSLESMQEYVEDLAHAAAEWSDRLKWMKGQSS